MKMDNNSACTWCLLSTHIGMTCQLSYYAVQLQAYINFSISAQIGLRLIKAGNQPKPLAILLSLSEYFHSF